MHILPQGRPKIRIPCGCELSRRFNLSCPVGGEVARGRLQPCRHRFESCTGLQRFCSCAATPYGLDGISRSPASVLDGCGGYPWGWLRSTVRRGLGKRVSRWGSGWMRGMLGKHVRRVKSSSSGFESQSHRQSSVWTRQDVSL